MQGGTLFYLWYSVIRSDKMILQSESKTYFERLFPRICGQFDSPEKFFH